MMRLRSDNGPSTPASVTMREPYLTPRQISPYAAARGETRQQARSGRRQDVGQQDVHADRPESRAPRGPFPAQGDRRQVHLQRRPPALAGTEDDGRQEWAEADHAA